ncbi:DUF2249 domain-containing protein [Paenibacillus sp. JNUCC31]|uniref:DUF2249 domain-containing protein n=1 Tax=Paenibacillus sp. JNUCC-31 TaxID=2777983 RepID=UPI00177B5E96|nr:DUF2249 domain-containing protein [Paenibacillus sp. JNUCC-31]QOS79793.1 DUF2249 domain-containing protein [Paenibacillus sp. JNUCC-31]
MSPSDVHMVELDVRPHLSKKLEPFQLIMDTVKGLRTEDVFVLHTPFKPTPLLGILKLKGYSNSSERKSSDHWVTTFIHKRNMNSAKALSEMALSGSEADSEPDSDEESASCAGHPEANVVAVRGNECLEAPTVELDNRGLQPPQPMMRTLAALERCKPGDIVVIHNDRVPVFLIEELNNLGCPYMIEDQADGTAKVRIEKG